MRAFAFFLNNMSILISITGDGVRKKSAEGQFTILNSLK